ncbi:MAG: GatB/YqeY domain-containing protein [Salinibacter sp.]
MSLLSRITEDLKQAMRDKDKVRLRTLRSLRAALQNKEIGQRTDGTETELDEQEALSVLRKQINQRKDSIEQYEQADRDDLVQNEQDELEVLEAYMPETLSDDDLEAKLQSIVETVGAESMADMGAVMGRAMSELRGRVDGDRVRKKVESLLSS